MRAPCSVIFNFLGRDFFNALSEKNADLFMLQLGKYLVGFALGIPVFVYRSYCQVGGTHVMKLHKPQAYGFFCCIMSGPLVIKHAGLFVALLVSPVLRKSVHSGNGWVMTVLCTHAAL